jgi:preprotein translocase subunit SecF
MEVKTPGPADLADLRSRLSSLGLGEVALQEFGEPDLVLIRVERQEGGEEAQQASVQTIQKELGTSVEYRRIETVGPKVGSELIEQAVLAILLAMLGIMAYIWFRFEWQFAVAAIVSLFHVVLATVGLYALLSLEFNLTSVAAVLTVAGYAINDTVVVYDRVRDELRRYKRMPLPELLNMALNRTLSRTVMTGGSVIVALLILYFFGGDVLSGFSLAMLWGVVIGTYSSLCLASPLLLYMHLRREKSAPAKEEAGVAAAKKKAGPVL